MPAHRPPPPAPPPPRPAPPTQQQPPPALPIHAKGRTGHVTFDGTYVTITRDGFFARTSVGKGQKRIPLGAINSIQWKPPGLVVKGYIQFETSGGGGTRAGFGKQTAQARQDENSVIVTSGQEPQFERLREAVEAAIAARHNGGLTAAPPSAADELVKLGGLFQQGLLSREEFEAAKARLLGR